MSEGYCRVVMVGNLGQDPELRHTQGGNAVLNMRMAINERWKDRDGNHGERTEWHTIVVWGKRAEPLARILEKGARILVEGRLQTRSWEAKDGGKRSAVEIVADNIVLLGGGQRGAATTPSRPQEQGHENEFDDDDIPF